MFSLPWWVWVLLFLFLIILLCRLYFGSPEVSFKGLPVKDIEKGIDSRLVPPSKPPEEKPRESKKQKPFIPSEISKDLSSDVLPGKSQIVNPERNVETIPSEISAEPIVIALKTPPCPKVISESAVSFTEEELDKFYRCKRPFIGKGSRGERTCRAFLKSYFKKDFKSCRPHFLINPETGSAMEFDCYDGELRLAVEFQGRQHYHFTPMFHQDEEDFLEQQRRDQLKAELCVRLGIYLIRVPYSVANHDIGEFIRLRLPPHLRKSKASRNRN